MRGAIFAVVLLAGCATSSGRLAQPPWHVTESPKTVAELAGCIVPLVRDLGGNMQSWPDGNATHYAQMSGPFGETSLIVTLRPTSSGSLAELRSWTEGPGYRRLAEQMDACGG